MKWLQVEVYLGIVLRDVRKATPVERYFSKRWWDNCVSGFIIFPAEKNILTQSKGSEFVFHGRNMLF